MKVIHGISQIKKYRKPVVALGVFDGVHLGHRRILKAAVRKAQRIDGTSVALTFWPHPQKEENIYSLKHRLKLIEDLGIDVCIVMNFTRHFARMSAVEFVKDILVDKINAKYIYVGKNFCFGRNAQGNTRTLQGLSKVFNFKVKLFGVIKIGNRPISSTYIRDLIKTGQLNMAQRLLCTPVSILGTVIRGSLLGRRLGFPTANIDPHHEVIPPEGIYAVRVIFGDRNLNGVCYIGTKPTIKSHIAYRISHIAKNIEVHIFDFKEKVYGEYLEIQFIKKIRDERKFPSFLALSNQIRKDITRAKRVFSRH
jgi:riboflavin kinase/FMN adenylyltransferase